MGKFDYLFDETNNVVVKTYHGEISIEDIESSWIFAFRNSIIPPNVKGFLLDYRDATFKIASDETSGISGFYKDNIHIFGGKKIAIITLNPRDIVIPVLVEMDDDGYYSRPFSDYGAAMAWITQ